MKTIFGNYKDMSIENVRQNTNVSNFFRNDNMRRKYTAQYTEQVIFTNIRLRILS